MTVGFRRVGGAIRDVPSGRVVGMTGEKGSSAAFSPSGRILAIGSIEGHIELIPVQNLSAANTPALTAASSVFFGHRGAIGSLAFSPDERRINLRIRRRHGTRMGYHVCGRVSTVSLLRANTGCSRVCRQTKTAVWLPRRGGGRKFRVWRGDPSHTVAITGTHDAQVTAVALSNDGARLVSGAFDGRSCASGRWATPRLS